MTLHYSIAVGATSESNNRLCEGREPRAASAYAEGGLQAAEVFRLPKAVVRIRRSSGRLGGPQAAVLRAMRSSLIATPKWQLTALGKRTRGAWSGLADRAGIGGAGAAAARRIKLDEGTIDISC